MRRALALAVCSSLLLSGCGRKREYPPPDRYVPADAPLAVLVPGLGTAARQAGALYRTIAQAPQAVQLTEAYAALKAQLGFDPLDPRGMEQAGVDPAGAAAAALGLRIPGGAGAAGARPGQARRDAGPPGPRSHGGHAAGHRPAARGRGGHLPARGQGAGRDRLRRSRPARAARLRARRARGGGRRRHPPRGSLPLEEPGRGAGARGARPGLARHRARPGRLDHGGRPPGGPRRRRARDPGRGRPARAAPRAPALPGAGGLVEGAPGRRGGRRGRGGDPPARGGPGPAIRRRSGRGGPAARALASTRGEEGLRGPAPRSGGLARPRPSARPARSRWRSPPPSP